MQVPLRAASACEIGIKGHMEAYSGTNAKRTAQWRRSRKASRRSPKGETGWSSVGRTTQTTPIVSQRTRKLGKSVRSGHPRVQSKLYPTERTTVGFPQILGFPTNTNLTPSRTLSLRKRVRHGVLTRPLLQLFADAVRGELNSYRSRQTVLRRATTPRLLRKAR